MVSGNLLVSVIIPCYNVSAYVEKAVRSILQQTYSNLEIIIVDDASTDETVEIIREIKDNRIELIELPQNTKKIGAVNAALRMVSGELIAFQDADDSSEPTRIAEQVNQFIKSADLGICFTKYRLVGEKSSNNKLFALTDRELKDEFLKFGSRVYTNLAPTMCATMMITKEVLNSTTGYHQYFTGRVGEDIHWVYRILKEHKGITINKILYNINFRDGSFTQIQYSGKNGKYAYSWHLLSFIISKEQNDGIDVLSDSNFKDLLRLELNACELALEESIQRFIEIEKRYKYSTSYRLGKLLLSPFRKIKSLFIIKLFL